MNFFIIQKFQTNVRWEWVHPTGSMTSHFVHFLMNYSFLVLKHLTIYYIVCNKASNIFDSTTCRPPVRLRWWLLQLVPSPFSTTNKDNIEIYLFSYCSANHVYFLVLQQESSLLGLYGPVLLHLLGNTGKYSPSCQTNTENQLFQYCPTRKDNTGSITFRNWECLYYDSTHCQIVKLYWGRNILMQAVLLPAFTSSIRQGHCPTDSLEEGHLVYYY